MTREPLPKALRVRSMMVCSDCGAYAPEGMADPEHPHLCLDCAEQEEPEPYPSAIRTAGRFLLRNPSATDQDVADHLLAVGEAGGVEVAAHARELLVAAFRLGASPGDASKSAGLRCRVAVGSRR